MFMPVVMLTTASERLHCGAIGSRKSPSIRQIGLLSCAANVMRSFLPGAVVCASVDVLSGALPSQASSGKHLAPTLKLEAPRGGAQTEIEPNIAGGPFS
jgi:hypothetical protein